MGIEKVKSSLTSKELFEITTGVLGHLTDLDQLKYLAHFVDARIKYLDKLKTDEQNKSSKTI